jgi:hypothetical protein
MNYHFKSFDSQIGNSISPIITNFLTQKFAKYLYFFDIDSFIKVNNYNPCISSLIVIAPSSSFSYEINYNNNIYTIHVHNSTLQLIIDKEYKIFGDMSIYEYSRRYYLAVKK